MTVDVFGGFASRAARFLTIALVTAVLAGCSLFGPPKHKEEPIVPAATLYQKALDDIDRQYFQTAIKSLEKLERQHPRDPLTEKSKLMQVFANYRANQLDEAILAADRYLAIYPNGKDASYVMYLKGNSYFAQIKDITRDQQLSTNAIETYQALISTYPKSEYVEDAKEKLLAAFDQLAGKEMSVGR
ncbi:MAG: outer membrane protein assembly factor BamD, partial [Candidatus Devosia euplotis]|nr:outer membrane protein assembly factor BamD [Candidatus Devosia euplotis]